MTPRPLLAAVALGLTAAAAPAGPPADAGRFAPAADAAGAAEAAAGSPLARGAAGPTRPRAEAFVPGTAGGAGLARHLPPFRDPDAGAVPDRLEVVFYARTRPVRVRVAVTADGRPLAARWADHLAKLFRAFDRDGDGFLNRHELDLVFPADGVKQMLAGGFYYRSVAGPPAMAEVDRDGDGRASPAELAMVYRAHAARLLRPRPTPAPDAGPDTLTRELFARLDKDKDGKLAEAELRAAEKVLLPLDADDDECVSSGELLTNPAPKPAQLAAADGPGMMMAPKPKAGAAAGAVPKDVRVFDGEVPKLAVDQLAEQYDGDKDGALTRAELGLDPEAFARLDRDGDGRLTPAELDGWRAGPPDAVVTLDLADVAARCKAAARRPDGGPWPAGFEVRQTEKNRVVVRAGTQTMDFAAAPLPPDVRRQQVQAVLSGAFPTGNKPVEEGDLAGPQNQLLRVIFDPADGDGDGRLTKAEAERYLGLQQATADLGLTLGYAVRTPNLFQLLDDNQDGKLSARELRTAWDRLAVLEPSGARAVTQAALQPSAALRLSPAAFAAADPARFAGQMAARPRAAGQPGGPVWFRKMDRNGDGDISRAEFLGPDAAFAGLDADGDGLVSLAEAEAYQKKARK